MRHALLLVLALAGSACSWPAEGVSYKRLNSVTGTLIAPDGTVCSATTVARHAIATTRHCIEEGQVEVRYQGILYRIERVLSDGREGLLVRLHGDLSPVARIGRKAREGDPLWIVGNPGGLPQLLRTGQVSLVTHYRGAGVLLVDCRCWMGDSGAGLFNADGRLVGIHYGSIVPDERFQYPMAYPLTFTRKQWREARR